MASFLRRICGQFHPPRPSALFSLSQERYVLPWRRGGGGPLTGGCPDGDDGFVGCEKKKGGICEFLSSLEQWKGPTKVQYERCWCSTPHWKGIERGRCIARMVDWYISWQIECITGWCEASSLLRILSWPEGIRWWVRSGECVTRHESMR